MPRQLSQSRLSALPECYFRFFSFLSPSPSFLLSCFFLSWFISRAREAGHARARLGTNLPNMDERLNFNQSNLRAKPTSEIRSFVVCTLIRRAAGHVLCINQLFPVSV